MKCKICGSETFEAHQILYADVICDGDGEFVENLADTLDESVYGSDRPYGPFTCTKCGAVYEELVDNGVVQDLSFLYAPIKGHPTRYAMIYSFNIEDTGDKVMVTHTSEGSFEACEPFDLMKVASDPAWDRTVPDWLVANPKGLPIVSKAEIERKRGAKA